LSIKKPLGKSRGGGWRKNDFDRPDENPEEAVRGAQQGR